MDKNQRTKPEPDSQYRELKSGNIQKLTPTQHYPPSQDTIL